MSELTERKVGSKKSINGSANGLSNGYQSLSHGEEGDFAQTPIAICGIGARLPGGICNRDGLKNLLIDGCDARGPHGLVEGKESDMKHGNCLQEGIACFDASMFSMTEDELKSCTLNERVLLEVVRECLEDAGETDYRGEKACVGLYVESDDLRIAKRVSLEYDLRGPR